MTVALRQPITVEEFLDWEGRQEMRYELDGLQPVAMTGGTFAHDRIAINLAASLVPGCGAGRASSTAAT